MYLFRLSEIGQLAARAEAVFPREASGLLVRRAVRGDHLLSVCVTSDAENTIDSFRIRDAEIDRLTRELRGTNGRVGGCFHSHSLGRARPSRVDRAQPKKMGELWLIYSVPERDLQLFEWNGTAFRPRRYRILL